MKRLSILASSLFFFGVAFVTLFLSLVNPQTFVEEQAQIVYIMILLAMILLFVIGTGLLKAGNFGKIVISHPPVLITGWVIIFFGIPGLVVFSYPEHLSSIGALVGVDYVYATWGFGLILVGVMSLWAGYGIGLINLDSKLTIPPYLASPPPQRIIILFYLFTVALRLVRIVSTGIAYGADRSGWGNFLSLFDHTITVLEHGRYLTLAVLIIQVSKSNWSKFSLFAVFLLELIFAFSSGFMKPLLWIIVVATISALYAEINLRRLYPIIPIFLMLGILIVPISEAIRHSKGQYDTHSPTMAILATQDAFQESWGSGIDVGWNIFWKKMMGRQANVSHGVGIIIAYTPSKIPYQGMDQFLAIPVSIIPRFIWTTKPNLSRGAWFGVTYMNQPYDTTSSSALTVFGETYMFGGWFGTIFGLFSLGLILSFLFRQTVPRGLVPVYISLIPIFLDVEGQFSGIIVRLIQTSIVLLLIYSMLRSSSKVKSDM